MCQDCNILSEQSTVGVGDSKVGVDKMSLRKKKRLYGTSRRNMVDKQIKFIIFMFSLQITNIVQLQEEYVFVRFLWENVKIYFIFWLLVKG